MSSRRALIDVDASPSSILFISIYAGACIGAYGICASFKRSSTRMVSSSALVDINESNSNALPIGSTAESIVNHNAVGMISLNNLFWCWEPRAGGFSFAVES